MEVFTDERSLHLQDETFSKLRDDADQVLQKLLANMAEKGSLEGKLAITVDVSFVQETVQNRDANIEGETRVVYTPRFKHKVGSVLQIKNEQNGDMNCDGMEMYWDTEKGEWMLRPITGRDQMSIHDIFTPDNVDAEDEEIVEGEALEGRKISALPGTTDDVSDEQSEDSPKDEEDLSDEFGDDYNYDEPDEF